MKHLKKIFEAYDRSSPQSATSHIDDLHVACMDAFAELIDDGAKLNLREHTIVIDISKIKSINDFLSIGNPYYGDIISNISIIKNYLEILEDINSAVEKIKDDIPLVENRLVKHYSAIMTIVLWTPHT